MTQRGFDFRRGRSTAVTCAAPVTRLAAGRRARQDACAPKKHETRLSQFDLSSDIAVVTGASSGLGAHFARLLAANGAKVALLARRLDLAAGIAREIEVAGGEALALAADITHADDLTRAIATVEARWSAPSLLVNNAGIAHHETALDLAEADWDRVMETNLKGAFLASQVLARHWVAAKAGGNIVNIASILGIRVAGRALPYAVSKAGLIQMTRALALEWARHGIRVNALAPGYILTDLNKDFFATPAGAELVKRIPQRRMGALADLDGPLLLLASSASAYMTGAVIPVDGGHLNSGL